MFSYRTSARAKHIRLTIDREGRCIVTLPSRGPREYILKQAEDFIKSKSDWIEKHVKKIQIKLQDQQKNGGHVITPQKARLTKEDHIRLKQETLKIVTERLVHFNQIYKYTYHDVRVKKLTSRWGSCSRKGNLNFSHKLALLAPEERDYIVVHELCHLGEFNHSAAFWKLVEKAMPDYKAIRKNIKGKLL